MNKLEKQIFDAFDTEEWWALYYASEYDSPAEAARDASAKIAATIALDLAEKAYHVGWSTGYAVATVDKDEIIQWDQFKQEVLFKSCNGYPNCDCSGNCLEAKKFGHPHK